MRRKYGLKANRRFVSAVWLIDLKLIRNWSQQQGRFCSLVFLVKESLHGVPCLAARPVFIKALQPDGPKTGLHQTSTFDNVSHVSFKRPPSAICFKLGLAEGPRSSCSFNLFAKKQVSGLIRTRSEVSSRYLSRVFHEGSNDLKRRSCKLGSTDAAIKFETIQAPEANLLTNAFIALDQHTYPDSLYQVHLLFPPGMHRVQNPLRQEFRERLRGCRAYIVARLGPAPVRRNSVL
jgi:hypothetical protein